MADLVVLALDLFIACQLNILVAQPVDQDLVLLLAADILPVDAAQYVTVKANRRY